MAVDQALIGYISFMLIVLVPVSIFVVFFYAEPGFPWHTYVTLVLGFYAAFGIMLTIPIDIAVVIHDRSSTTTGSDPDYDWDIATLSSVYNTFFTMVLILGSVVLVFEEYFNTDGYFTLKARLYSSFKRMCWDLFVPGVVGLIVLGILIGQKVVSSNADALKLTMVVLTNTIYETGLMFLLGYSLVEFPRWIWVQSNLESYLLKVQTRASQQFKDISEAQLSVSLAVSDVRKTKTAISSVGQPELALAMETLLSECPPEFTSDRLGSVCGDKDGRVTIDSLAKLRTRLNVLKDSYKMAQAKVEGTKLLTYTLEDLIAAKNNPDAHVIHWSLTDKDSTRWEYFYQIRLKPFLLKIAAIACAGLSILSLLGVICSMTGVSNGVSPYFLAIHRDNITPAGICVFIFVTFAYTINITTWALFEMKLGAAMELVPGRTTPEALSFNIRNVARLAAPLAFFYLGWISENGIRTGSWIDNDAPTTHFLKNVTIWDNGTEITVLRNATTGPISMPSGFSNFYQLQNISAVQAVFGTVFPIILFVVMGLVALNIFNRLLVFLKLQNYQFGDEIITEVQLREGKRQLERHKATTIHRFRRGDFRNYLLSAKPAGEGVPTWSILSIFCPKKTDETNTDSFVAEKEEKPSVREPAILFGTLEKKGAFSLGGGGGWKEFYGEVRSPGYLHLHKDRKTADLNRLPESSRSNDPQATIIDLRNVIDFKLPEKKTFELELDLGGGESARFKFKNGADQDKWRRGLKEWKDFIVDYGMIYPNGVTGDTESRGSVSAKNNGSSAGGSNNNSRSNASNLSSNNQMRSPLSQAVNELDSIQIEDDDEDERGVRPLMKSSSSTLKKTASTKQPEPVKPSVSPKPSASSAAHDDDDKPAKLEGWLEKKGSSTFGSDWSKRFIRIDENTSSLQYFKSSDPKEKPNGTIDLKLVKDITFYEKNGKPDYSRFNLDAGDGKVFKFRALSESEGQRWIEGLNAWRDYFLLNMA